MTSPRATLRLQFHCGFNFRDAIRSVPYLDALNVSHLYASPILKARAGSTHGYDVVDPTQVNPELGGEPDFRTLVGALRAKGLGIIIDIVPNHMAVGGDDNAWWLDVLQNGRASAHAKFFDIDWNAKGLPGKILAPFLGRPYVDALAAGDITLVHNADSERYEAKYFQHRFPIRPEDQVELARRPLADFDPATAAGRWRLHDLLERQNFRLAWWRIANDAINWRRFFDINELAALRSEDDDVFEATHGKIFELYAQGLIDGVRIDHIDGLADPRTYCRKLRARLDALAPERSPACMARPYIVVEKILGAGENLPADWLCDGTTGYDFMDQAARILHDAHGAAVLDHLWHAISRRPVEFSEEEDIARRDILARSFAAQLESLVGRLFETAQSDIASRDLAAPAIRRVLVEILAHMRVYRIYTSVGTASDADNRHLAAAVAHAWHSCLPSDRDVLDRVAAWLGGAANAPGNAKLRGEAMRMFQQLSAPLAAKAVEDTVFYRHGSLLSRLDVGFDPSQFGGDIDAFHRDMEARVTSYPRGMLATATHDHKRGEDVRARLAVLSEIPDIWAQTLHLWLNESAPLFTDFEDKAAPSMGDAAILFQMIVGAWPLELSPDDAPGCDIYRERLATWQKKALREAKLETDWTVPNESYEKAARHFLFGLFKDEWRHKIANFANRIGAAGAAKGLVQTLVKLTCPGVPDLYQGTEFWDFSLVDPDNRRSVDFTARVRALRETAPPATRAQDWRNGRIKQAVIAQALGARRQQPELFEKGDYSAIRVSEAPNAHGLIAFARQYGGSAALIVGARLSSALLDSDRIVIDPTHWGGAALHLPENFPRTPLRDVFTGLVVPIEDQTLQAGSLLDRLPLALLVSAH